MHETTGGLKEQLIVIQQVLAVSLVLTLLAAALLWLRNKGVARFGTRGSRKRVLRAEERLILGPQHSLHLVRLAGRGLLVGTSPAGYTLLESFDWAGSGLPSENPEAR